MIPTALGDVHGKIIHRINNQGTESIAFKNRSSQKDKIQRFTSNLPEDK